MSISTMRPQDTARTERSGDSAKPAAMESHILRGVRVSLDAQLGNASLAVEELMALKAGSIVTLQTGLADPVGIFLNDTLIARGEIVAVGDKYAVRILEVASPP